MTDTLDFVPWPKTPRLNREVVVTEKLDGSNGQIYVRPKALATDEYDHMTTILSEHGEYQRVAVRVGSRNRWLLPDKGSDNAGFCRWVWDNCDVLVDSLGLGRHYGEWWGDWIRRGYGLNEKRFSLFDTRWTQPDFALARAQGVQLHVVPTLYTGNALHLELNRHLADLRRKGSVAAPGFPYPEGVVLRHSTSGHRYKVLLEGDELPKGVTTQLERELLHAA